MENNIVENNVTENIDMKSTNLKNEKLRYQTNGTSYKLGFLGILFSVLAAFVLLNSLRPSAISVVKILINIAICLFGFMACEKVKFYSKKHSIYMFVIGGACVARIFWAPIILMTNYVKYQDATAAGDTLKVTEAKNNLANAVINAGSNYLPQSGIFRGILAIILLILAALCFIGSGIVCWRKNAILMNYLKSINENI